MGEPPGICQPCCTRYKSSTPKSERITTSCRPRRIHDASATSCTKEAVLCAWPSASLAYRREPQIDKVNLKQTLLFYNYLMLFMLYALDPCTVGRRHASWGYIVEPLSNKDTQAPEGHLSNKDTFSCPSDFLYRGVLLYSYLMLTLMM